MVIGWRSLFCVVTLGAFAVSPVLAQESPDAAEDAVPQEEALAADARIGAIGVEGVQRVDPETVRTYFALKEGDALTRDNLNGGLKKLYATGLFSDVKLRVDGSDVTIAVQENPMINKVAFEGNKKHDDEALLKEITLRPRSVYSRPKVQQDVERIIDIYQRTGRFQVNVSPKIIPRSQNRVDLVFEVDEGPVTEVQKVYFVGNRVFSSGTLEDVVRTEQTRWYKFFSSDDTYDPDRMEYDKELLRRYYTERGYADFKVKSAIAELAPQGDGFYITYTVEEGDRYNFGAVTVQNALADVKNEDLEAALKTKGGETYNAIQVEDSVESLTNRLGDLGYAFIAVKPELTRNEAENTVDIAYVVEEGPRVYVDRINIDGNVRTLDKVIRREFRLAEGDPFSASKLKRTEQRLNNLDYFDKVSIKTERGSAPDRADINVEVEEKSTGELSLGAGFSTLDGLLTDISIKENNLLGAGKQLGARLMLASERQEGSISYTEPYFLNKELAAGFDIFKTKQDFRTESSYDRESVGASLRASYALTEHLQHAVNYTLREDTVSDVDPAASLFIKAQQGKYVTSSVGHSLTYDLRDNKFEPTEGYVLRLRQDAAGLGGDVEYLRTELNGGYFYSVVPQWVINVLGSGGYIWGMGDPVRINDRFFLGSRDVRGFTDAGIGPRDAVTRDAIGGNVYYATTVELNFPLSWSDEMDFRGAAFIDAGSLWDPEESGAGVFTDSSPRVSAGVGVAWASPFGPIRLDFAHAILKEDYDETEVVKFTFGTRF